MENNDVSKVMEDLKKNLAPEIAKDSDLIAAVTSNVSKHVEAKLEEQQKALNISAGKFDSDFKTNFVKALNSIKDRDISGFQTYTKALNTATNNQGGYFIPTEFLGEAKRLSSAYGVFRRNTEVVPFSGQKASFGTIADVTVSEQTEMAAKTDSTPTVGTLAVNMKTLYAMILWSNQFADMSPVSVFDILLKRAAAAFAYAEDVRGLVGSATFTGGILQNSAAFSAATAATGHDLGSEIDATDLATLIGKLNPASLAGAKFYMSMPQFVNIIFKQGSSGQFVVDPIAALGSRTLLGFPVELSGALPASPTATTKSIILGDLANSTYLFEDGAQRTAVSTEATVGSTNLFEKNMSALRVEKYLDIVSFDSAPKLESAEKSIAILSTAA